MRLEPEVSWAFWARNIYINRYKAAPKPVYERLFYTQGDYGLFQSVNPEIRKDYDNEEWVMRAMEAQGFVRDGDGVFQLLEK